MKGQKELATEEKELLKYIELKNNFNRFLGEHNSKTLRTTVLVNEISFWNSEKDVFEISNFYNLIKRF